MIERLWKSRDATPDDTPDDAGLLNQATEAAGVGDYDFFRAAWRGWHGSQPNEKALERAFVDYLFRGRAPGFARHFARRILEAQAAGRLDPSAFGLDVFRPVNRPRTQVNPAAHFATYAALATALLPFM